MYDKLLKPRHSFRISLYYSNWLQEQFCNLSSYAMHILSAQYISLQKKKSTDPCVSTVTRLRGGKPFSGDSIPGMGKRFPLFSASPRPALAPSQPPLYCVQRLLHSTCIGRWERLITRHHLVPRLGMCGAVPPLSHIRLACTFIWVKSRDDN